jgi:hypothetical protein
MYCWWKVFGWRDRDGCGVKLGPITVAQFVDYRGRAWWTVTVLNRWCLVDTYLDAVRRGNG